MKKAHRSKIAAAMHKTMSDLHEIGLVDDQTVRDFEKRTLRERRRLEEDDMAWAKPLVDEALEDIKAGRVYSLEEHDKRMDALFKTFERKGRKDSGD